MQSILNYPLSNSGTGYPTPQRALIIDLALEHTELSPRELSAKIVDEQQIYVSESSVYHILKERRLIQPMSYN